MPTASRFLPLLLLAPLWAQEPSPTAVALMNARLDLQSALVTLRTERNLSKASDAVKADVDKLTQEAMEFMGSGNTSECRRRFAHALALLAGRTWNPREE